MKIKNIITVLAFALMPLSAFAWGVATISGGVAAGATYLVNQNFEGTGYDNGETWSEYVGSGATVNEDYATSPAPLAGAQSLYVVGGSDAGETYTSFSSSGTIHVRMMIRFTAQTTSTHVVYLYNADGSDWLAVVQASSGHNLVLYSGGQEAYGATSISTSSTYYLWVDYTPGTGSNSTCSVYISTSSTKPGTPELATSGGNETATAGRLKFSSSSSGLAYIVDQVRVDDAAIADGN